MHVLCVVDRRRNNRIWSFIDKMVLKKSFSKVEKQKNSYGIFDRLAIFGWWINDTIILWPAPRWFSFAYSF